MYPISSLNDDIFDLVYSLVDTYFANINTITQLWGSKMSSKIVSTYGSGAGELVNSESYQYNSRNQIVRSEISTSKNELMVKEFQYPSDSEGNIYHQMVLKNIVSPVIRQITKIGNREVENLKTNYTDDVTITTGLILPKSVQRSLSGEADYRTEITYDKYDLRGNILQYTYLNGAKTSLLWSYFYKYPIAEIENLSYDKVAQELSSNGLTVQSLATSFAPDMYKVNSLRNTAGFKDARITTFTYKPLIGMTSQTDPKGLTSYYQYDNFQRLWRIKDQNGKIVKEYNYHYKQ